MSVSSRARVRVCVSVLTEIGSGNLLPDYIFKPGNSSIPDVLIWKRKGPGTVKPVLY